MTVKSLIVGIKHHASLRRYLFPMVDGCLSEDLVFCCRFIGYQIWWETISLSCIWLLCVWLFCALQGETLKFRNAHNLSPASHETKIKIRFRGCAICFACPFSIAEHETFVSSAIDMVFTSNFWRILLLLPSPSCRLRQKKKVGIMIH